MIKAQPEQYQALYEIYCDNKFFFPLIGAVLLKQQNGVIYVDNPSKPKEIYVEHAFGFAQVFGEHDSIFEEKLENYLFTKKNFESSKVRLYTCSLPIFVDSLKYQSIRSTRQRFTLYEAKFSLQDCQDKKIYVNKVDATNVARVDAQFKVITRFWKSYQDFVDCSRAIVVSYNGNFAAICYAAAVANKFVEIDVLTLPEYQKLGLGKIAVRNFVQKCFNDSLIPLWDCFTNNNASMALAKSVGFEEKNQSYHFYTINK